MFKILSYLRNGLYLNSSINIVDNTQIIIENCKNILECNEMIVRVVSSKFIIEVWGSELYVSSFANKSIRIDGEITNVSLIKRGNKK